MEVSAAAVAIVAKTGNRAAHKAKERILSDCLEDMAGVECSMKPARTENTGKAREVYTELIPAFICLLVCTDRRVSPTTHRTSSANV